MTVLLWWLHICVCASAGLGDIALPGVVLAFLAQMDERFARSGEEASVAGGDALLDSNRGSGKDGDIDGGGDGDIGEGNQMIPAAAEGHKYQAVPSYFQLALAGYIIGLFQAIFAASYFHVAQPALLYLVPDVLVPVNLLACHRSQFSILWLGPIIAGKKDDGDMENDMKNDMKNDVKESRYNAADNTAQKI
jgi:hypothetical protein